VKTIKKVKTYLLESALVVLVFLVVFIIFQASFILFQSQNLIIPVVDPALAIVFGYVGSTVFEFFAERKKSVMMKGMFSQYVSTHLVNELILNPDKLRLGGEKKNLTVLFSDIAGFTSFSEGKTAEEVVTFINAFLDEMSESVLQFDGTLDKYLGDSVMAFWGAPIELPNHSKLACKCALDMKKRLEALNQKWGEKSGSVKMRIGINSGEVVVGNIGGKKRFDYTVMGDNVNLASRLEGANKIFGTAIMLNESTYNEVKNDFAVRQIDNIRVKGKKSATKVFELLDEVNEELMQSFTSFNAGLVEYEKGNFDIALKLFEQQYELNNDSVSKLYIDRCKSLLANPPEFWDGITTLTEK
jgi:adenylate cyclase